MAQNQDFSTLTHEETREELEVGDNKVSNTTINLEKIVEPEIITNNAEQLVNSKTTVQDNQISHIVSSEINITNEILPDQTLENTVSKGTKDFIGDDISVHTVEAEKILGDGKDHITIDRVTTKETAFSNITITPKNDTHLTHSDDNDEDLLFDRQYDFIKTEEKKSHDSEESIKNEENSSLDDEEDIYNSHDNIQHDSIKNEEKVFLDIPHDFVKTEGSVSLDDEEDVYSPHDNIPRDSINNGEKVPFNKGINIPHDSIKHVAKVFLDEDIDSPHDSVKTKEKVSLEDESGDSPYYSAKIDEKVSLDNDEDVESSTPSTPQGEENILATISKVAPELKQVLDTWNGELIKNKNSEDHSGTLGKDTDSDKLLQGEITYVKKEDAIEEEKKHDVRDEGDNFMSDIQSLPSKRIKDILDKDLDSDKLLQRKVVYLKENVIEEERHDVKDKDDFMSDVQSSPYKKIKNALDKDSDSNKLQDEITYIKKDVIEDKHNVEYGENFISSDIQSSPSKRIKIEVNLNKKQGKNSQRISNGLV
ncbi:14020_t:CDS:1 [Racocetra fulgida]|uniref:14020_t:CDS:1 n=1 Tax=Racocetra fulgida TaxID=60492 RepID=A0A9N9AFP6_9GLOM|nr:14020_t:CDS:1 [Racocetra fulgida]